MGAIEKQAMNAVSQNPVVQEAFQKGWISIKAHEPSKPRITEEQRRQSEERQRARTYRAMKKKRAQWLAAGLTTEGKPRQRPYTKQK